MVGVTDRMGISWATDADTGEPLFRFLYAIEGRTVRFMGLENAPEPPAVNLFPLPPFA